MPVEVKDNALAIRELIAEATVAAVVLNGIGRTGFNENSRSRATCRRIGNQLHAAAVRAAKSIPPGPYDDPCSCSRVQFQADWKFHSPGRCEKTPSPKEGGAHKPGCAFLRGREGCDCGASRIQAEPMKSPGHAGTGGGLPPGGD